ncbi:LuxR C-terminal-related transcriptional regulator [Amycolatopsis pittospori]|uniref:LuxR C-terminal-related transcriptional regulator n=1 Tax=Amycolatopsis pittospori TaxID=2749434 RepID=UPI0015F035B7|nr:LuxR C-terminal-related transcriptional regulator [Amycolatopsis pittospori]
MRRPVTRVEGTTSGKHDEEPIVVPSPKLAPPPPASDVLERDRLLDVLDEATVGEIPSVTLLNAPAGSGKTVLLGSWFRRRARGQALGEHLAWVSLDVNDNKVFSLWSSILRSLSGPGSIPGPALPRDASAQEWVGAFVDACNSLRRPVILVLDNAHELVAPDAVKNVNLLLRYLPFGVRVVIATRFPPPLILPRIRLEGRLREITAHQLNFTEEETGELLAGQNLALTKADLDEIVDRTQGWAAGLRFLTLALAADGTIRTFTGDDRLLAEYLSAEIVGPQPAPIREFLLSTSVCQDITEELATRLTGQENSGQILYTLTRTNALVTRQGPRYRCHPLLRGYLRAELGRRHPRGHRRLHRLAAEWCTESGDVLAALEHSIAAQDEELITRYIQRFGLQTVLKGHGARLHALLGALPEHLLSRPQVALVAAIASLDAQDLVAADRHLGRVDNSAQPLRSGRLRALNAVAVLYRARYGGHLDKALAELRATSAGDTGDVDLDLLALVLEGIAALWLGDVPNAKLDLERALRTATLERRDAVQLQCAIHLAGIARVQGDLAELAVHTGTALDLARSRGWGETSRTAFLYAVLGMAAYQRLDEETARRFSALATRLSPPVVDPAVEMLTVTLSAAVEFGLAADPHAVVETLRNHRKRLAAAPIAPWLVACTAPIEQRLALRVGEPTWAADVTERHRHLLAPYAEHALLTTLVHLHRGRTGAARRRLRPVIERQTRPLVAQTLIESWLLEAVLADHAGEQNRAHDAVGRALDLAAPQQALRPFHDAGQDVRELLVRGAGRFGRTEEFASAVLQALPARPSAPVDPLTSRELELLTELPSMRTTEQIADSLYVSVNTVKTHLRGIYRKLGVNHRRDAVVAARRRGLL